MCGQSTQRRNYIYHKARCKGVVHAERSLVRVSPRRTSFGQGPALSVGRSGSARASLDLPAYLLDA